MTGTTSQTIAKDADATAVTANDTTTHEFVNWTASGFSSADQTLTITGVTESKTYTANYTRPDYTLTFQHDGNGSLTGTTSQTVAKGADATAVTANDTATHEFVNWTASGFSSTDQTLTITGASADKTYTANYTQPSYTLVFQHDGNGNLTGTKNQTVAKGADATAVTANDTPTYEFVNWTAPGGFTSTSRTLTVTGVSEGKTYTANYAAMSFTVTASATPAAGGNISPATATIEAGQTQTYTVTVTPGYEVDTFSISDDPSASLSATGTENQYAYTYTQGAGDQTVEVAFTKQSYVVTTVLNPAAGGTITPANPSVEFKASQVFTVKENAGYTVDEITVGNDPSAALAPTGTAGEYSYSFTQGIEEETITVSFDIKAYSLTSSVSGTGGTISASATVDHGGSHTFTVFPDEPNGYELAAVLVDGVDVSGQVVNNQYNFTNVAGSHTIKASFQLKKFTIQTEVLAGAGSISPTTQVVWDGSYTVQIAPDSTYEISEVLLNGQSLGVVSSYQFSNVKRDHLIQVRFAQEVGSLQVILLPVKARALGAACRLEGTNEWRSSGQTTGGLNEGIVTIEFRDVPGYKTLANRQVTILAGQTVTLEETYEELPPLPVVNYFTADSYAVGEGSKVRLRWHVTNADDITIDPAVGAVDGDKGRILVSINQTTTFELTAKNNDGSNTAQVTVRVQELPRINWFSSASGDEDNPVSAGQETSLSWNVNAADQVVISSDNIAAAEDLTVDPQSGNLVVGPTKTTEYTLVATNEIGTVSKSVIVHVSRDPGIDLFVAEPASVLPGSEVILRWSTTNARKLSIDNGVGVLRKKQGELRLTPAHSVEYTLLVSNRTGSVKKTVAVEVVERSAEVSLEFVKINGAAVNNDAGVSAVPSAQVGVTVPVVVLVRNDGEADAEDLLVRLTHGGMTVAQTILKQLNGGGTTKTVALEFIPLIAGDEPLVVEVDPDGAMPEANKSDNVDSFVLTTEALPNADLVAVDLHVVRAGAGAPEGALEVTFRIINVGDRASQPFQYSGHLLKKANSPLYGNNDVVVVDDYLEALEPGQSVTITRTVMFAKRWKRFYLFVLLDSHNAIEEFNKDNNTAILKLIRKELN